MRIPRLAAFKVSQGREIAYAQEPGVQAGDIVPFLMGSVFGILLHQRRMFVLHASAVRVADSAVLFCGPSGFGKSTLAAALNRRGHPFLLDDICVVDFSTARATARCDGRWLKLWSRSVSELDLAERRRGPVRPGIEKFYVEPDEAGAVEHLPISMIFELTGAYPGDAEGIRRINPADAARVLSRNAFRRNLVDEFGLREDYFRYGATLAAQAPVYQLIRASRLDRIGDTVALLEQQWREAGMLPKRQ